MTSAARFTVMVDLRAELAFLRRFSHSALFAGAARAGRVAW